MPYRARAALLSPGELRFYRVLRRVVGGRWGISVKPRLADVIWCPPELWDGPAGARVAQKHLDFVLYDVVTTAIVLAVELDDRSHALDARRRRDAFVDAVLGDCGVELLRVRVAGRYDAELLRRCIEARAGSPDAESRLGRNREAVGGSLRLTLRRDLRDGSGD